MCLTDEVARAVATARQAQAAWGQQPLHQRLEVIRRARHHLATDASALARCVSTMPRRSLAETLAAEVLPLAEACRFVEREAPRLLAPHRPSARNRPWWLRDVRLEIRREPLGVVLIIAPANYPLFLPGVQMVQALAAGNAVLLKPGTDGTLPVNAFLRRLEMAGLDRHLVRVLPESPEAARAALAAGVDKVLCTGSAATGVSVLEALAPQLTSATLELSGCDAAFVRADADVDLVARALAFSLRLNGGATCIAPRRVFVHHSLLSELETRLIQAVSPIEPCPVPAATAALLRELLQEACEQGSRRLTGALRPDHTMTPVVVSRANAAMRLLQTDVLAPILALVSTQDDDAALRAAMQCPYALGATVFGTTRGAESLAQRVRAGVVVVNDVIVPTADPRLPFGGRGRSGYGITRGAEGLLELTALKAVTVRRGGWRPHYEPLASQDAALFEAYITASHGATWRQRLAAGLACLGSLVTRQRSDPPRSRHNSRR